jgi:hypothetical protein
MFFLELVPKTLREYNELSANARSQKPLILMMPNAHNNSPHKKPHSRALNKHNKRSVTDFRPRATRFTLKNINNNGCARCNEQRGSTSL